MRTTIVKYVALFTVLLGIVGIAAADPDPCPAPGSAPWSQAPDQTIAVFYSVNGINNKQVDVVIQSGIIEPSVNGVPGIREVCLFLPNANPSKDNPTAAINVWALWEDNGIVSQQGVATFKGPEGGGENNNIPLNGNLIDVGYSLNENPPDLTSGKVMIHINDPDNRCAGDTGAPSKAHTRQLVKIQHEERLATTSEPNPTPSLATD